MDILQSVRESIEHRGIAAEREPEVVSEKIFPTSECATIVFVVSCLAFSFCFTTRHSPPCIVWPSKLKTNDFKHSGELRKSLVLMSVLLSSCVCF